MRRTVAALTALTLASGPAFAAPPGTPDQPVDPTAAPAPAILLAQTDIDALDADIEAQETLEFFEKKEFDASAQSLGAAVALSLIPGAGWGLIYADKSAQSTVPFLLSAVGYAVGGLYVFGLFDEEAVPICNHVRDGRVGLAECDYGDLVLPPDQAAGQIDSKDIDPRDPEMLPYFATKADYSKGTRGDDFDGITTGLIIIGGTYVLTTLIGAVWAGGTVYEYNEQLRKDIESTAGRDAMARADDIRGEAPAEAAPPRPFVGYDGERGVFGVALDF